jgi:hypothetical protein
MERDVSPQTHDTILRAMGESTPVSKDDLLRFAQYDLLLCRRDGCRVHTVVVYTKAVPEDTPAEVDFGSILYRPHVVHLARRDGDAVLDALDAKVRAGGGLDGEEQIRLALSCLMRHDRSSAGDGTGGRVSHGGEHGTTPV